MAEKYLLNIRKTYNKHNRYTVETFSLTLSSWSRIRKSLRAIFTPFLALSFSRPSDYGFIFVLKRIEHQHFSTYLLPNSIEKYPPTRRLVFVVEKIRFLRSFLTCPSPLYRVSMYTCVKTHYYNWNHRRLFYSYLQKRKK